MSPCTQTTLSQGRPTMQSPSRPCSGTASPQLWQQWPLWWLQTPWETLVNAQPVSSCACCWPWPGCASVGLSLSTQPLMDSAALAVRHRVLKLGMELLVMGGSIRKVWLLHLAGDHWDSANQRWGLVKHCSSPWPMLSPLGAYPVILDNFG